MGWRLPESGWATMTHYDLPTKYVAACGCVQSAPTMPSVALNVLAFGSQTSFGPSCGLCAKLTLIDTPLAYVPSRDGGGEGEGSNSLEGDPRSGDYGIAFTPQEQADGTAPSVVVKVVDSCPQGPPWCNATVDSPNQLGSYVHFDLAWPSVAIPNSFFPGDHDYGVWNVSYEFVSCSQWQGYKKPAVLGSDWIQQNSACCPKNPPLPSDPEFNNTVFKSQVASKGMPRGCPNYADTLLADPAMVPNTSNPLSKHDHDGTAAGGAYWTGAAGHALRPSWMANDLSPLGAALFWTLSLPTLLLSVSALPLLS